MHERFREVLQEVYDALAADVSAAGPVCEISGRCCRFEEYGHTLFLSRPEAELLLEQGLPRGAVVREGVCPFQIDRLCTARERRPLGCRVYFCDPSFAGKAEALSEKHIAELKRRHEEAGLAWEYRPLHVFLREFADSANSSEDGRPDGR